MFDYPYDRIAAIVGKSEAATRPIATRARRHVDDRRARYDASERRREELAERFSPPPATAISRRSSPSVVNRDKFAHLRPVSGLTAMIERAQQPMA